VAGVVLLKRVVLDTWRLFASRRTSATDIADLEVSDVVSMITSGCQHPIGNRPSRTAAKVLLDARQRSTRSP
jgi:hypothetical protein